MLYSLSEIRSIPILFIVGKGRSGTTLLSTILDCHPKVASATESRFLLILWQKYKKMSQWDPSKAEEFISDVLLDLRIKHLWDFHDNFLDNLKNLPAETKAQDLIKLVYLQRKSSFPKEKIQFIVDKNPMYTLFVDHLVHIFPSAKFYRLVRDPRDNIASHIKYSKNEVGMLAFKWLRYNQRLEDFSKRLPQQFFSQRFEDLIMDKSAFFKEFEDYTEIEELIEHESKRIEFKNKLQSKMNKRLKDQHQASVKPLDRSKIGHYKEKLSDKQINDIEGICFPFAEIYGYRAEPKQSTLVKRKWKSKYNLQQNLSLLFYSAPFWLIKFVSKRIVKKISYQEANPETK
jgi:hypothetical protein